MSLPDFTIILPAVGAADAAWEASGLAAIPAEAIRDAESDALIPAAQAFLDALDSDGRSSRIDFIEEMFPATTCGTTAACFGHDYVLFRQGLFHADRDSFDRIFAAYVPRLMGNNLINRYDGHKLHKLGIWVLYEPETSAAAHARLFHEHADGALSGSRPRTSRDDCSALGQLNRSGERSLAGSLGEVSGVECRLGSRSALRIEPATAIDCIFRVMRPIALRSTPGLSPVTYRASQARRE